MRTFSSVHNEEFVQKDRAQAAFDFCNGLLEGDTMIKTHWVIAMPLVQVLVGCGSQLAGTYVGDARLLEGRTESSEAGYSLDEMRAKIAAEGRKLTLERNGRFTWNTGSAVLEGTWRVDGDTLFIRDDTYDGRKIGSALQKDRVWKIGGDGELIYTGRYNQYNLEVVYKKE